MNKKIIVFFLVCNLHNMNVFSMRHGKQKVKKYQNISTQASYYMSLLASELSIEKIKEFKGQFIQYKEDFLHLKQAINLYQEGSINLCNRELCKKGDCAFCQTRVTKKRLTTETFLALVNEDKKEDIMQKLLHSAVSQGDEESIEFLFEQDVDLGDAQEEFTLLEVACLNSHQGVASMLLEKTAGVQDTHNVTKKWSLWGTCKSIIK